MESHSLTTPEGAKPSSDPPLKVPRSLRKSIQMLESEHHEVMFCEIEKKVASPAEM